MNYFCICIINFELNKENKLKTVKFNNIKKVTDRSKWQTALDRS